MSQHDPLAAPTAAPPGATHREAIARLNDAARAGSLANARTVFTRALAVCLEGEASDPATRTLTRLLNQAKLLRLVGETAIAPGNDPHGERDFGVVDFLGQQIFWKIDVYENDGSFSWGAEVPWDAARSYRIVTIMLASDY